jgi:hypothetical protein
MASIIQFKQKGDFSKTESFLKKLRKLDLDSVLRKYGELGVQALASATPVETGKTAASWDYKIEKGKGVVTITWTNSNVNNGVPIALLIQYGHGTGTGGYVQGRDYIKPAILPIFDELADALWEEVTKL